MCFCVFQMWALSKEQKTRCNQHNSDLQRKRSQVEKRLRSSLKKKWGYLVNVDLLTLINVCQVDIVLECQLFAVIYTMIIERSRGQEIRVVKRQTEMNVQSSCVYQRIKGSDPLMDILHCLKQGGTPMVKHRLLYVIISCMRSQQKQTYSK